MPSTSPYNSNDYQAANSLRPYSLPVNDIFKASSALNAYWEMGAAKVKNAYEGALNLNLVTDDNKKVRDDYLEGAEKQLTKLSSMDLSDPSVQRQGLNIFRPLLQDENIIGEDYVVKNLNKEYATGQSYRTRGDGKEYNPLSIENIQFEKQLLSTGLNKRDGWKSIYQSMSTYTPNYDTTGELKKITDLVKSQEITKAQLAGDEWYISEINQKGVSKDRILAAIEELGSPQLKGQMRVEGRNTFYKHLLSDPNGVDPYFQSIATNLFDRKIQDIKSNKAEIDYQNYMISDKDPQAKSKKEAFQQVSDSLDKSIRDLESNQKPKFLSDYTNLSDLSHLSSNISKVEQLWQSAAVHNLAPSLAWESSSQQIKPNSAKIAKENLNVAIQRLTLGYTALGETKRHNMASEQIDYLEALNKAKGASSSSTNPIFGGASTNGIEGYPTPQVGTVNENEKAKIAESARNTFLGQGNEEQLRQTAISNILGDNAWAGLQQNIESTAPISQNGALTPTEIDKAAAFFKAFGDKYTGTQIPGVTGNFNNATSLDAWKKWIEGSDIGRFKRMVGSMVKYDSDFSSDLINKLSDENGPQKSAKFKAAINSDLRRQMNMTNTIFREQVPVLGEYAKYFDNNGRIALTDANISTAYKRYVADKGASMQYVNSYNINPKTGLIMGSPTSSRIATPEELRTLRLAPGQRFESRTPSTIDFQNYIRQKTDPIFYKTAAEFNTQQFSYAYPEDKAGEAEKVQNLTQLANLVPAASTDAMPKIKAVLEFMSSRMDKVKGYSTSTPAAGETLPTMQLVMQNLNKEDQQIWDQIKDVRIPVIAQNKTLFQKGSNSGDYRFPGAVLVTAPLNNQEKGSITITNASRNPQLISPEIKMDNVYVIKDGKKREITSKDVQSILENQFKMPLDKILESYLDEANEFISAYTTNIDAANKAAKDKKDQ